MKDRDKMTQTQQDNTAQNQKSYAKVLVVLCVILYTVTTAGKKIFESNKVNLGPYFGASDAALGLIGTYFFIACAVGQILHGIFCKFYNVKWVIFGVLLITGGLYGCIPLIPKNSFWIIKYLWILNGLVEAALWTSLLYFLNTSIANKYMSFTFALLALPTPIGNCLSLGISSLFSFFNNFKLSFYLIFILYMLIGGVWLAFVGKLQRISKREKLTLDGNLLETTAEKTQCGKRRIPSVFVVTVIVICVLCVLEQICYEGLINWLPSVLKGEYGMAEWISQLLTILLPIVAYLGNMLGKYLQTKTKNYFLSLGVFFSIAMVCCGVTVLCFGVNSWIITFVCAVICTCVVAAANMIESVIYPMENSEYINSGLLGGIICASMYGGCAISGYGLGSIADNGGWLPAFKLLFFLMLAAAILALSTFFVVRKKSNKVNKVK